MFAMAGIIILAIGFIYHISMNNQQLAPNNLKYRYVMMRDGIEAKELLELETYPRAMSTKPSAIPSATVSGAIKPLSEFGPNSWNSAVKERKTQKLLYDTKN